MDIDLEGFQYENAPWKWGLHPVDHDVCSMGQLYARFHENYSYSAKPLAWVRDPKAPGPEGKPYYSDSVIIVPFSGNFYVVIEKQFREVFGPHRTKLLYKARQVEETYWVATMQLEAMFYSDERMLIALTEAITQNRFYISESSAKIIVIK